MVGNVQIGGGAPISVQSMTTGKTHDVEREKKFVASVEAEKSKKDVLNKKFDELFQKAKAEPNTKPVRDIDLDFDWHGIDADESEGVELGEHVVDREMSRG